jgi:hypothetical protein
MSAKLVPLLDYLDSLNGRADLKTLQRILHQSGITEEDISEHASFNDNHYARNKISGNDWFTSRKNQNSNRGQF